MKCAEQVRNIYVRVQMWKAVNCYIISTINSSNTIPGPELNDPIRAEPPWSSSCVVEKSVKLGRIESLQ